MLKAFSSMFRLSLGTLCYLYATTTATSAQVTSDGTTNTTVNSDSNGNFTIEQGDRAGNNLFHSFGEFSVPTSGSAFFNNAADISNIFSRVTGGNISNIDGLIGANGTANLFLINPAGILFGENARLDIGGSFFGTTADSILFEDGEFSATNLDNPPLLTINAPIGLNLRDNPGEIVNRSFVQNEAGEFVGLEVNAGESLSLVGGDVTFDAGEATARGGKIEIGGLRDAGTITIEPESSLTFPEGIARANIFLTNAANVVVASEGGGSIAVNANNIDISGGEFGSSFLSAGILSSSISADAQAGNITINATGAINISDGSGIFTQVEASGIGNAGNIEINTTDLTLLDGSLITAGVFGTGNAGNVTINALGDITFQGIDFNSSSSGVLNNIAPGGSGNAGTIQINAANLNIVDGGTVSSTNFGIGLGNAGNIQISVKDRVNISGFTLDEEGNRFFSNLKSTLETDAIGNAGNIEIDSGSLTINDSAFLVNSTFGQGDAGNVVLNVAGAIEMRDGLISSSVNSGARGNAGSVLVNADNLLLIDGGVIFAGTSGNGNAGSININANNDINFDGESSLGFPSSVISNVEPEGVGNAGEVTVVASNFSLTNGGVISARTFGLGNAGAITIDAAGTISADGESSGGFASGVFSTVEGTAVGNSGGVNITTTNLTLTQGGVINGSTFGQGNAGLITINAAGTISADGESSGGFASTIGSTVEESAVGDSGGIDIKTSDLTLTQGGVINGSTSGQGNAGAITIDASGNISAEGESFGGTASGIFSLVNPTGVGDAAGINIDTNNLSLTDNAGISVSSLGEGNAANLTIVSDSLVLSEGAFLAALTPVGTGGSINLQIDDRITLRDNSLISAQAFDIANGGNLTIDTNFLIAFPEGNNAILANAEQGAGGSISINAEAIFGFSFGRPNPDNPQDSTNTINASSEFERLTESSNVYLVDFDSSGKIIPADSTQTIAEACSSNRNSEAKSVLAIEGRGGVLAEPGLPLNSNNIYVNGETNSTSTIPEPIETAQGKIQPARGIKVTESGEIILTAYRTNNAGERLPENNPSCS